MSEPRLCDFCEERDATWVVDRDTHFGGGENGPAFDAPVIRVACEGCKGESSYMEPEPLTEEWERWFDAPWTLDPIDRRRDREWRARNAQS